MGGQGGGTLKKSRPWNANEKNLKLTGEKKFRYKKAKTKLRWGKDYKNEVPTLQADKVKKKGKTKRREKIWVVN